MRTVLAGLLVVLAAGAATGAAFHTTDPLKAFINSEYPLGSDFFINGVENTYVFRCALTYGKHGLDGIALSEISIWGNRTGPWDLFRSESDGNFTYVGTRTLTDTSCLESCSTKAYLAYGRCNWRHGWPGQ